MKTSVGHARMTHGGVPATHWSERRRGVLLCGEHEHGDDEERGDEHLDEHALRFVDPRPEEGTVRGKLAHVQDK